MSDKLETVKNLKPIERRFLKLMFTTDMTETDCYINARLRQTSITKQSASVIASRMKKRVMENANWTEILEAYELDDARLAKELDARLKATKVELYEGQLVKEEGETLELEDNTTRMRATTLLAEIRGKKKAQVDVNHGGKVDIEHVHVYLPENGRDE